MVGRERGYRRRSADFLEESLIQEPEGLTRQKPTGVADGFRGVFRVVCSDCLGLGLLRGYSDELKISLPFVAIGHERREVKGLSDLTQGFVEPGLVSAAISGREGDAF